MRIVLFYHSLISDWNHGNAHFLRGVATELLARGHDVRVYEPANAWSVENLRKEFGEGPIDEFRQAYPGLDSVRYDPKALDLDAALGGADLVIVHEWSEHDLVRRIGEHRARTGGYQLLFHDTHHRAVTQPEQMAAYDLTHYDGVLAFGNVLRDLYLKRGWAKRAWAWHEAADMRVFRPLANVPKRGDLVWVGNWGDEERTAELHEFLLEPVRSLGLRARIHGVRYPQHALDALKQANIEYGDWLPNFKAPETFAAYRVTVHVMRRPYIEALPGIPTIRVFEALACGIPLVCSPWDDAEGLFTPGKDYLVARDGAEMKRHLRTILNDPDAARELSMHGHYTVLSRHTCAHRVDELMRVYAELQSSSPVGATLCRPLFSRPTDKGRDKSRPYRAPLRSETEGIGMPTSLNIAFFASSLVSAYWNGAATYYRGIVRALHGRGHRVTFFEPDAYDRQKHRDIPDPDWAEVVVYSADGTGAVYRCLEQARGADLIVKASGVGVFDELLEAAVLDLKRPTNLVAFWDVDAPATLDRVRHNPADPFKPLIARYDLVLTYGGGEPVVRAYEALGAKACVPIYNALDPSTHHPVAPDPRFAADLGFLGNRLPDREARVEEFFLTPAAMLPERKFLIGGNGWGDKPMPANVRDVGHVYTRDHNAFNCTPLAVLNVNRDSMARYGFSPATRVFEAAGAGACLITDAFVGVETFFEPDKEILVARDGDEVAEHVRNLTPEQARGVGQAALARVLAEHTYDHRAALLEEVLVGRAPAAAPRRGPSATSVVTA